MIPARMKLRVAKARQMWLREQHFRSGAGFHNYGDERQKEKADLRREVHYAEEYDSEECGD